MAVIGVDPGFWKDKKVLVTGHTGFKGSWLTIWLKQLGAKICGVALKPDKDRNLFNLARVSSGIENHIFDIRELEKLRSIVNSFKPDIVFHLAAQALVRKSYQSPLETYEVNVMGSAYLLETLRLTGSARSIIMVTSDKCYENRETLKAYNESDPMGGYDPYSSSKGCMELLVASYRQSYFSDKGYANHGTAIASVRAGNVIGGGDWSDDRLIPDIIAAISEDRAVTLRNPDAIRPWQHVIEPLSGYLTLARALYERGPLFAEAWNFGPSHKDAQAVRMVAQKLIQYLQSHSEILIDECENPHEANLLRLDCSKAEQRLHWKPALNLDRALKLVADWHAAYLNDEDMEQFTQNQIQAYSSQLR